jgi:hypothetical protein
VAMKPSASITSSGLNVSSWLFERDLPPLVEMTS